MMIPRKKKILPKRKYHDGDIIQFNFKSDSLDIHDWQDVILVGVITGVLYEKNGIIYRVQLRDNSRNIFGDVVIPEVLYEKNGIIYRVQLRDNSRNIFGDVVIPEEQINEKVG